MAVAGYLIILVLDFYAGWLILIGLVWGFFAWRQHQRKLRLQAFEEQRQRELGQEQHRQAQERQRMEYEHHLRMQREQQQSALERDRKEREYQDWLRREQAQADLKHQEWLRREEQRRAWEQDERLRAEREQEQAEAERREREREQRDALANGMTLRQMLALTPTQFELLVAEMLTAWGYTDVRHVGGSGDLGADVMGTSSEGELVVVQCKRYAPGNLVGSPEMQKFIGMAKLEHCADKAIFVTTSAFSTPAAELGRKHDIELIDGDQLIRFSRAIQYAQQQEGQPSHVRHDGSVDGGDMHWQAS